MGHASDDNNEIERERERERARESKREREREKKSELAPLIPAAPRFELC